MENLIDIFKPITESIDVIGIVILVLGFAKELIKYLIVEFKNGVMLTPLKRNSKNQMSIEGLYSTGIGFFNRLRYYFKYYGFVNG